MNIRQFAKRRTQDQARYRVTCEPDYAHEAWHGKVTPTPQSHPGAFYPDRELLNPRPAKNRARKAPHETLSVGALKKRLYRAGITGQRAAEIAREIHAGQGLDALTAGGVTVLGWSAKTLEDRYGKRIARAVTRFVHTELILLDEGLSLLASGGAAEFVQSSFQRMRKYNAGAIDASQCIDDLARVG